MLGKTLNLNGTARTIVGVMPAGFTFPGGPNDFWTPAAYDAAVPREPRSVFHLRCRTSPPTATLEQARAEMGTVAAQLSRDFPIFNAGRASSFSRSRRRSSAERAVNSSC